MIPPPGPDGPVDTPEAAEPSEQEFAAQSGEPAGTSAEGHALALAAAAAATEGPDEPPPADEAPADETPAESPTEARARPPARPILSLEGRAAPGLYVGGWLLTVLGLALALVALLSAGSGNAAGIGIFLGGFAALSLGLIAGAGSQALQRHADGVAGYAGPSPFLVFAATIVVANLIYAPLFLVGGWSHLLDPTSPAGAFVSLLLSTLVYVGLIRLLVVGTGSLSWREMGIRRPDRAALRDFLAGISTALPVYVVVIVIATMLTQLLRAQPSSPLPSTSSSGGILLNLASAALVAPFGEELFFRGYATTAWWRSAGPGRAIVQGALFFALVHVLDIGAASFSEGVREAAIAFLARLPVALALGWLFVRRRGSLFASFGLHSAYNALGILLALLAGRAGV